MKTPCLPWVFGLAPLALGWAAAASTPTGALIVKVELRHQRGALACALYGSPAGFPGDIARARATLRKPIAGKQSECAFPELPAGDYAVSVVHDENGNGKLDLNFLGMPTEGWGATNNVKPRMSAPTFEQSKVTLRQGQRLVTRVRLNY